MFMVIPFASCIARPKTDFQQRQLLKQHLLEVAECTGNKEGMPVEQLAYLAGLCHDFGKADSRWQNYIIGIENKQKITSVPHAQVSSCIFFFLGLKLAKEIATNKNELRILENEVVKYTLDIADHHGELSDVSEYDEPWKGRVLISERNILPYTDVVGFLDFITSEMPMLVTSYNEFDQWFDLGENALDVWENIAYSYLTSNQIEIDALEAAKLVLRINTGKMIYGDRLSAAKIKPRESLLLPEKAKEALENIKAYCQGKADYFNKLGGSSSELTQERNKTQEECVNVYLNNKGKSGFFTLELPTGYGKTITSLRIALEAIARGDAERIIYVAPYISILSQVTDEIKEATKIENIIQHHHMSTYKILAATTESNNLIDADMLDSWQAPIVTTTFVQLFRALFPNRAQHTMRLVAMKHSFIIVDEPQSIDANQWNLFTTMINGLAFELEAKVMLVTATLPRTLQQQQIVRIKPAIKQFSRYKIAYKQNPINANQISEKLLESWKRGKSTALIANTIADCYQIYSQVISSVKATEPHKMGLYCLSGLMTSLHKKMIIEEIKESLKYRSTLVICTQVLEAGVDLSFDIIFRAIAPIPSIIQSAGRLNRHGEKQTGMLNIFEFVRFDNKDSSVFVYEKTDLAVTRDIIQRINEWPEVESQNIVKEFYTQVFNLAPREGSLNKLKIVLNGKWSEVGGLEPYKGTQPTVPVFIDKFNDVLINKSMVNICKYFGISSVSDIWVKYLDKSFIRALNFTDRKAFTSLMQMFSVPTPVKLLANTIAIEYYQGKGFVKLIDANKYNDYTGLMGFNPEDDFSDRSF